MSLAGLVPGQAFFILSNWITIDTIAIIFMLLTSSIKLWEFTGYNK